MSKQQEATKTFLEQVRYVDQRISSKIEQVQSLRDLATKATSVMSEVPPSGSRNVHRMEDVIVKMIDLEQEINDDIDELVDLKSGIMTAIKQVNKPEYQTILELRYLCLKTWGQIAEAMNYDERWVRRLHDNALFAIKPY
ncbi:hypothetical protein FACS1894105_10500 [Clostridia bacterium]|nr:hypothetical protein FACS1894105_10500 [Clostridia bacterium]